MKKERVQCDFLWISVYFLKIMALKWWGETFYAIFNTFMQFCDQKK